MTDIPPPPSGLEYLLNTHVMVSNNVEPWLEEYQTTLYRHDLDDTEVYDGCGCGRGGGSGKPDGQVNDHAW